MAETVYIVQPHEDWPKDVDLTDLRVFSNSAAANRYIALGKQKGIELTYIIRPVLDAPTCPYCGAEKGELPQ